MSSAERIGLAVEQDVLPADTLRAALGALGLTAAEELCVAEGIEAPTAMNSVQQSLDDAFAAAGDIYPAIKPLKNMTIPPPESFRGIEEYCAIYDQMQEQALDPEFVLSPQLTRDQTRELFEYLSNLRPDVLERQKESNFEESSGLHVISKISKEYWDLLAKEYPRNQQFITLPSGSAHKPVNWTLSIFPSQDKLLHHRKTYRTLGAQAIALPTITQLISLHAQRLHGRLPQLDTYPQATIAAFTYNANHMPTVTYQDSKITVGFGQKHEMRLPPPTRGTRPVAFPGSPQTLDFEGVN